MDQSVIGSVITSKVCDNNTMVSTATFISMLKSVVWYLTITLSAILWSSFVAIIYGLHIAELPHDHDKIKQ